MISIGDQFRNSHPVAKAVVIAVVLTFIAQLGTYLAFGDPFRRVPPLADNLSWWDEDMDFTMRLKTAYPNGTREEKLLTELRQQGFTGTTLNGEGFAGFSKSGVPCERQWGVTWRSVRGRAYDIRGSYGHACL